MSNNIEEKEIFYGNDFTKNIVTAIEKVYRPVSVTLGSHGKYVALDKKFTKDGVSIAREILVESNFENVFIRALVDASMVTLHIIGDGTTSTIILSYHMIVNMFNSIDEGSKSEKFDMKKFFDGVSVAIENIEKIHAGLKDKSAPKLEDLISVATTSSNGDKEFGGFVGRIYDKIGSEGIIEIDYKGNSDMRVEYADGYIIDSGLLAYEFVNNNGMSVLNNPYIFITNREISDADKFLSEIAEVVHNKKDKRPLFVIASGFSKEVLSTMVKNADSLLCCPIIAPSSGDMKNGYLEDLAKMTNGIFINAEKDMHLSDLDIWDVLGECKTVSVKINETVLIPNETVDMSEHIKSLEELKNNSDDENSDDFINKRIIKIKGSVATLFIKKSTITEMSLNHDRYDDSIKATRSSIKNGVMSGGGRVYIYMAKKLTEMMPNEKSASFEAGYETIAKSLKSILEINLRNSNHSDSEIESITEKLLKNDDLDYIYDTARQDFGSSREFGILESYMSSIVCIRNAYSVAKTIVNTQSAVLTVPKLNF